MGDTGKKVASVVAAPFTGGLSLAYGFGGSDSSSSSSGTKASSSNPYKLKGVGKAYYQMLDAYNKSQGMRQSAELADVSTQQKIAEAQAPGILSLLQKYTPQYQDVESAAQARQAQSNLDLLRQYGDQLKTAASDPQTEAIRQLLGSQIQEELGYGANLDPALAREIEQGVRAGQSARGMTRGAAPVSAEALMKGTQAQALRQQRQQAATQFLNTQATTQFNPWMALTGKQATLQSFLPQNYVGVGQMAPGMTQQQAQMNFQKQMMADSGSSGGGASGALSGMISGGSAGAMTGNPWAAGIGALLGGVGGYMK